MSSIIEAQQEYFERQFMPLAPNMPVVKKPIPFFASQRLRNEIMIIDAQITRDWIRINSILQHRRKEFLWDDKLESEQLHIEMVKDAIAVIKFMEEDIAMQHLARRRWDPDYGVKIIFGRGMQMPCRPKYLLIGPHLI